MLRGLKLTQIKSHGLDWDFNRYQLSEHELIPVQSTREPLWLPGRILHHLQSWEQASYKFKVMCKDYDGFDVEVIS